MAQSERNTVNSFARRNALLINAYIEIEELKYVIKVKYLNDSWSNGYVAQDIVRSFSFKMKMIGQSFPYDTCSPYGWQYSQNDNREIREPS